ncbi:hypothetical protein FRC15_006110 [Serendipita sp. 397]|nr:hypothetical protein FRC15_006110 [Serendipita sp. 397]
MHSLEPDPFKQHELGLVVHVYQPHRLVGWHRGGLRRKATVRIFKLGQCFFLHWSPLGIYPHLLSAGAALWDLCGRTADLKSGSAQMNFGDWVNRLYKRVFIMAIIMGYHWSTGIVDSRKSLHSLWVFLETSKG